MIMVICVLVFEGKKKEAMVLVEDIVGSQRKMRIITSYLRNLKVNLLVNL